jgi:hypothetical protein
LEIEVLWLKNIDIISCGGVVRGTYTNQDAFALEVDISDGELIAERHDCFRYSKVQLKVVIFWDVYGSESCVNRSPRDNLLSGRIRWSCGGTSDYAK